MPPIGNFTGVYLFGGVACEYFGAHETRSRVVHVVGFGGGHKFEVNARHLNPSATGPGHTTIPFAVW